jgi:hypothetical protein
MHISEPSRVIWRAVSVSARRKPRKHTKHTKHTKAPAIHQRAHRREAFVGPEQTTKPWRAVSVSARSKPRIGTNHTNGYRVISWFSETHIVFFPLLIFNLFGDLLKFLTAFIGNSVTELLDNLVHRSSRK